MKKGNGYTISFRLKQREIDLMTGGTVFGCHGAKPYAYYFIIGAVVEHAPYLISQGKYEKIKELLKVVKFKRGMDTSLVEALLESIKEKVVQEDAIKKALVGGEQ